MNTIIDTVNPNTTVLLIALDLRPDTLLKSGGGVLLRAGRHRTPRKQKRETRTKKETQRPTTLFSNPSKKKRLLYGIAVRNDFSPDEKHAAVFTNYSYH